MAESITEPVILEQRNEWINILNDLFNKARLANEFEYVCCLLRIRGMEDAGWDPLEETFALVADLMGLINGPLHPYAKIRITLLLYAHLIEVDAVYLTGQIPKKSLL